MSKIKSTIWQIEPHTEAKHEILRKYLNAWLPIVTRWSGRVLYIDGFAGPGEYIGGKDGSPIIAIKALLEHKAKESIKSEVKMIFIEADSKRSEFLKHKIDNFNLPQNVSVEVVNEKFDKVLTKILDYLDEQKKILAPAFAFIDPFGFTGIPFDVIKRIMNNEKCEVLITFMYEEINRFIGDEKLWSNLRETFGTDDWIKVISIKDPQKRCEMLHNIYVRQLESETGAFVRSFKMINKLNKTDYFLFFATKSITGLKKMKWAMWKVDESGTFNFSDATYNPNQPMLFELQPNYPLLEKIILDNFKGKIVSVKELENFILTQTPFRESHYKKSILVPFEKSDPPKIERICPDCRKNHDCKRRKTFFPEDCIVKFL